MIGRMAQDMDACNDAKIAGERKMMRVADAKQRIALK